MGDILKHVNASEHPDSHLHPNDRSKLTIQTKLGFPIPKQKDKTPTNLQRKGTINGKIAAMMSKKGQKYVTN